MMMMNVASNGFRGGGSGGGCGGSKAISVCNVDDRVNPTIVAASLFPSSKY